MYLKTRTWAAISLLCFLGALYFWDLGDKRAARERELRKTPPAATNATNASFPLLSAGAQAVAATPAAAQKPAANAPFPYRISNTARPIDELVHSDSAILLRNALIDSASGVPLDIPQHLRAQPDTRSYIVQAHGVTTDRFREQLKTVGAEIVSYVPNNAYLVRAEPGAAQQLAALPEVQTVTPWQPYFKLAPKLLALAVEQQPLPDGNPMSILAFPGETEETERQLRALGGTVMSRQSSPFGTQILVHTPADKLVSVAQLDSVQAIEPAYRRAVATDLARTRVRVSTNTVTPNSHLDLMGEGIRVGVNDTGVDQGHPELTGRVFLDAPATGIDNDGHGTHVAAIVAGRGATRPSGPVPGSTNTASFRGMAPKAEIFAQPIDLITGPLKPDALLQEIAALSNVFVCNNSWGYLGAFDYTFASAVWDAAVRDSVPSLQGSQDITYVFAAGNSGFGDTSGGGGFESSIWAPGTAKNVITVGATEQLRNITNEVVINGQTNQPFAGITDSDDQVASFSSRGNVGPGIEGPFGRFKPDVCAPGTFVVSARAAGWASNLNVNVAAGYLTDEVIAVGDTNIYFFFGGSDTFEARVRLIPNARSPIPFPTNSIYVRRGNPPPPSDYVSPTNTITFPLADDIYYIGFGNNFNQDVHCDIQIVVLSRNPPSASDNELVRLNQDLEPNYRYESGTSMAAPVVSGMLALMQEHLKNHNVTNPSPALMKALLINGARSFGQYNLEVDKTGNHQGWGMANLTNSLPAYTAGGPSQWPVRFFDQETNGLVTGQSATRQLTLSTNTSVLRATLVWTDPPGNPSVGAKLVNDLDLIITNLNTIGQPGGPDVYVGNRISGDFSEVVGTNAFVSDVVNNVENIYIRTPRAGNYSVTVRARRVNVNAVTAHNPNGIAQDYALVISSGSPGGPPVFTIGATPTIAFDNTSEVIRLSNGVPVLLSRVGANPPFWTTPNTNGLRTQWRFFEFENTGSTNTNVAFFAFLTPNLSRPRTSEEADIDLYVSLDSNLTNLNPAVLATAFTSRNRGGTEAVVFTNAATGVKYYIGVKSEDQQAATFGLFGFAGSTPFSQRNPDGSVTVNGLGLPIDIPDGSSEQASGALVFAYCLEEISIRNVIVTNTLTHENGGDLLGLLEHSGQQSVLNNHRGFEGTVTWIYDDSDSGQIVDSIPTDAPGTLRNFWGQEGLGPWQLVMVDDSLISQGRIDALTILLQPRQETNTNFVTVTILPNRWYYTLTDVPADASLLGIDVAPSGGVVEVYARHRFVPDQTLYDHTGTFGPPGGSLEITPSDSPPLSPGRYFVGLFNPNSSPLTVNLRIRIVRNLLGSQTNLFRSGGSIPLIDDALTTALLNVTNSHLIADARVGVRIQHQRASDLVLTLVSPAGTRVLLAENRGGNSALGYGGSPIQGGTNYTYTIFTDDTNLTTTPIKFAQGPFTNAVCPTNITAPMPGAFVLNDGFENNTTCNTVMSQGSVVSGWLVETNDIDVGCANSAHTGAKWIDLNGFNNSIISRSFPTTPGANYVLSFAYCRNPQTGNPNFVATCNVQINGQVLRNISYGLPNTIQNFMWQTTSIVFQATGPSTQLRMVSTIGGNGGMYLDSFTVAPLVSATNGCNYFFPEEPLTQLRGENAFGTWRLEVLDNRVGAPLNAQLLSWQLEFDFVNTNAPTAILTNGICYSGVVAGSNSVFFQVQVPFVASWATNELTSSNGSSLRLGADVNMLPRGARPPDDYFPVTGSPATLLISTGSSPQLPRGQRYYLAVQNTDPNTTNHFTLCVTFDRDDTNNLSSIITVTNTQCFTNVIAATNLLHYYQFDASSNAVEVTFELKYLSENADMVVSKGLPLPNPQMFFARSQNPGNQDENITLTDYNFGLGGRWYIGVYNRTNLPVGYTLCVREVIGVRYTDLTPFGCTNNAMIAPGGVQYFQYTVSPVALRTLFTVSNIFGGNVDMYISAFPPHPPPDQTNYIISSTNPGLTGELAVLSQDSESTPPLLPGSTYYIAITNLGPAVARYDLCIYQFLSYVQLTDNICVKQTLVHSNDANYFVFNVASNSVRADFLTLAATGDIDMYVRQFPVPDPGFFDYASAQPGVGNETIVITTNDSPVPLAPGDWYVVVVNRESGPVNYCIQATQTRPVDITPIVCTNAVTIAAHSVQYFDYTVSSNALRVLIQATNLTGNIDLYLGDVPGLPDPGPGGNRDSSTNPGTTDENIAHSRAFLLNPPVVYRIAVTNLEGVDVTYALCVIETTNYINLANGVCYSNLLHTTGRLDAQYYVFDVAPNAVQAEFNTRSVHDVNLYLRRVPIPGPYAGEHDYLSATGSGNESIIITTNSGPVPLGPGLWYLVVSATNAGLADYCVEATQRIVEDVTPLGCTNATVQAGDVRYFQVQIASNAFQADFTITNATGDVDLYINPYPPLSLPGAGNAVAASATPGAGNEAITLSSSSTPVLQPGTYIIAVTNVTAAPVSFRLCVTQITNGIPLVNAVCVTNTLARASDAHYYQVTIFTNSVRADFLTLNANGNVDLYVRNSLPPAPGPANFHYASENLGTTNEMIVVTATNSPVPLSPGVWYIAVVSKEMLGAVTYCIKVNQYPVLDPFNILLRITNGSPTHMDLGWNAFDFQRFHLEWTPTLSTNPIPWRPILDGAGNPMEFGPVGGTGTNFYHRDQPLSSPMRFYRLRILP